MRYLYILLSLILLLSCENKREEKYARWNQLIEAYITNNQLDIKNNLLGFRLQIGKEGNTKEGQTRLAHARVIIDSTYSLMIFLDDLQHQILQTESKDLSFLLHSKQGKAIQAEAKIRAYLKYITQENPDLGFTHNDFDFIQIDNSSKLIYQKTAFKNLSFINYNFKEVSKNQLINNLKRIQFDLLSIENTILKKLGFRDFGKTITCYFEPNVFAISYTNIIHINNDYKALIFSNDLISSSNAFIGERKLYFNNKFINLESSPYKSIEFKAEGQGEKSWQAQIHYRSLESLKDTIIPISQKYYVLPK